MFNIFGTFLIKQMEMNQTKQRKVLNLIKILMFNLQVILSDFRSRKRQFIPVEPLMVVLRFGSIKLDIKLNSNGDQLMGGKKIVLDISSEELKNMFLSYALGMFIENQQGRFFSILSLQKLEFSDIVSGQQVYFYNDNEEIFYYANFSLNINDFKNPRLPNKQAIQNHKTFDQFFKKPAIPNQTVGAKTLSSFLYGKKNQQLQNPKLSATSEKISKQRPSSAKPKNKHGATSVQSMTKTKKVPEFSSTYQPQFQIFNPYNGNQDIKDDNPPVMQFTNTAVDPMKGTNLLKTQMAQLNLTAPQNIKFMTAYDSKNGFLKTKPKDSRNTIIKIQEKIQNMQNSTLGGTKSFKENIDLIKVNRDELRNKAKQQMQTYQGNTSIKIPVLKDGKYELVQLAHLNEEEIANFAKKQKQLELEEEKKKMVEKELQKRQKENSVLKKQLQQKEKLLARQDEEAKKQKIQLLKAKQQAEQNKKIAMTSKVPQRSKQSQASYDSDDDNQQEKEVSQNDSDDDKEVSEEENNYESDFQSMSMASGQKKSRISVNSQKKQEESQSYNDYNESYDPDFESYSQSLLGSQQKLSMSQISQSLKHFSPKKR